MADKSSIFSDWHIRKEVQVGHIITSGVMIVTLVVTVVNMQRDIGSNAERIAQLTARAEQSQVDAYALSRLLERLDERSVAQSQQLSRIERRIEGMEDRQP